MTSKELTALAREVFVFDDAFVEHSHDTPTGYVCEVRVNVLGTSRRRLMAWGTTSSVARERMGVCLGALRPTPADGLREPECLLDECSEPVKPPP